MKKPIQQLPVWIRVLIRIILLPIAMVLHIIPHIVGFTISMKNWVLYGGEFITYQKNDPAQIIDIYNLLKNKAK